MSRCRVGVARGVREPLLVTMEVGGRGVTVAWEERVARGARGVWTHEHWWLKVRGHPSIAISSRARGWRKSTMTVGWFAEGFLHLGPVSCKREVHTYVQRDA